MQQSTGTLTLGLQIRVGVAWQLIFFLDKISTRNNFITDYCIIFSDLGLSILLNIMFLHRWEDFS